MASKLINLVALSSIAILAASFGAVPANALSIDTSPNYARHLGHHQALAKKRRSTTGRCKPRPSSSSNSTVASTSATPTKASSTVVATPTTTKKAASSKAPAATTVATTSSAGGGKVGLAWANGDDDSLKNFVTSKVSAIYSWSPWKPAGSDALGLEFAPMLWGTNQISDFKTLVVAGYANTALGFNEPDLAGQSNLSPSTGASLWRQYLEPLKSKGYSLGSPAVTSGSSGKVWLNSFLNDDCSDCTVDFITIHWYGTDAPSFIAYVEDFHTTFGKDIWVTEFACENFSGGAQCTESEVFAFMDAVTAFMDGASYVKKYFAFGIMHDMQGVNVLDQLMNSDGFPTALGEDYLT